MVYQHLSEENRFPEEAEDSAYAVFPGQDPDGGVPGGGHLSGPGVPAGEERPEADSEIPVKKRRLPAP